MKYVYFKVSFCLALLCLLLPGTGSAQQFGISFSYFIPKNGYFASPVSPFSVRGVGFDLTRNISITSGFTLYRMAGLGVTDVPFTANKPVMGPMFSLLVPLELVFAIPIKSTKLELRGGGFGFINFDNHINYGNLDRALKNYEQWEALNSDFTFDNKPGWGYHFGADYTIYLNRKVGIIFKGNYFIGDSVLNLKGTYTGGTGTSGIETKTADYPGSKLDFTGLEVGFGVIYSR